MSFRFWRRAGVAPGVTMNLSKSGGSLSFGSRGAKLTAGSRGGRMSAGIPSTGLFYTTTTSSGRPRRRAPAPVDEEELVVPPQDRLTLGFFKRLITPEEEKALVEGCRELVLGNEEQALTYLRSATHLADGAYLAGFMALKMERPGEASDYLAMAADKYRRLGSYFSKYGISSVMSLPITGEVSARLGRPSLRGVLLGLVEAYQRLGREGDAIACLERLRRLDPDDVMVKLSLAELILESHPDERAACRRVVRLGEGIENESSIHAALMLYKAKALDGLGLHEAAKDVLTVALRRRKDRSAELMRALRYERALVYEKLGQRSRSRKELERLFAEAPDYEDVAERLGV